MKPAQLIKLLKALGLEPRSYSGRGMHGRECVGVSVDRMGDHVLPVGWSFDQLGKGYIVYWPSVKWEEGV